MGLKLFVVEDEPVVRHLFALLLKKEGYEVKEFKDGAEALENLELHPDLGGIVSDTDMPNLSGVGLLRAIRGRGLNIPFVLLSGGRGVVSKTDPTPLEHVCRDAGNATFLFKPCMADELFEAVRSLAR